MSGRPQSSSAPLMKKRSVEEIVQELCSRFVINQPEKHLQSYMDIMHLVELAHWSYEDDYVDKDQSLEKLDLRQFTSLMFTSCAVFKKDVANANNANNIHDDYQKHIRQIPVAGAIILDEAYEKCLLVQGWAGEKWGFPRGKKKGNEEDHECAIREVLEETSFDVKKLLDIDDYLEDTVVKRRVRFYIVAGVKEDTKFKALTKNEIRGFQWRKVNNLVQSSRWRQDWAPSEFVLDRVTSYFVQDLKNWISLRRPASRHGADAWRTKDSLIGSSSIMMESQSSKPEPDVHPPAEGPGKSFLNFRFDIPAIKEAGFANCIDDEDP